MNNFTLECCVDSYESAQIAANSGATRLELCSNLIIGGTTPSLNLLKKIKNCLSIPVHVLIRPRFGDFLYNEDEFSQICEDINDFVDIGADGIVCGCLNSNGTLDTIRMKKIKELCKNSSLTLHRAFDVCVNPYIALKECELIGVNSILTSGQKNICINGLDLISDLLLNTNKSVDILVGGGVNSHTIELILAKVAIKSFHMSGKKLVESNMKYRNSDVYMGLDGISEYSKFIADESQIRDAYNVLKSFYK